MDLFCSCKVSNSLFACDVIMPRPVARETLGQTVPKVTMELTDLPGASETPGLQDDLDFQAMM